MCFFISSIYIFLYIFRAISFFRRECGVATPQWRAQNDRIAKNLWDQTCRLLHLKPDENLIRFLKIVSRQIAE